MKKIRVLHNKLLVKRQLQDVELKSGIILPDSSKKKDIGLGTVMQGNKDLPEGSKILFSKYAGTDINMDDGDNEYLVLDPRDVMALYEGVGIDG